MNFEFSPNSPERISTDAVVILAFETKENPIMSKEGIALDQRLEGLILKEIKNEDYKAKVKELLAINSSAGIMAKKIFVLGLGKKEDFTRNQLRNVFGDFVKKTKGKLASIAISLLTSSETGISEEDQCSLIAEGAILGNYKFMKYKSEDNKQKELESIIFLGTDTKSEEKVKSAIEKIKITCKATMLARDLVNEPSAVVDPTFLANLALDIAKKNKNIKCTIYDKKQAEKLGMGAFLGIAKAADTEPKFIHLEYAPEKVSGKNKIALVGKGITFDTGGISLKPSEHMTDMKLDMAGAAAVLGVFSVISEIKPKMPVMGLIAATPNMISGRSVVPGDVVRALNGKTIEILNTDAEGRVTLADSLSYAVKKGATHIIDLATLTGAAEVALGTDIAALFSNNEELEKDLKKAASETGEEVWGLPLEKTYKDLNKSDVADISNISSVRYGGAITGALFLEEFVGGKPWAHLDIAGPSFAGKDCDLGPKGGTGFGVRMLLNFLLCRNL